MATMRQTLDDARQLARSLYQEELELLATLARIPAPTGYEERRAEFVAGWLREAGAQRVEVDGARNVLCLLGETDGALPLEVYSAHTDVVFDDTDELPLRETDECMYAPGVGDDTANLVGLLVAARHLLRHPHLLEGRSVLVVANSCEEGLGNLAGTKAVYERYGERIVSHVAFDLYLGGVVSQAVGSHRWRVSCHTQGGHSFGDYGRPSAIHELCALVSELCAHPVPHEGCTRNVGVIEGGTTVNAIAAEASMLYEYRSVSDAWLGEMREELEAAVARRRTQEVDWGLELVGERPGGVETWDEQERLAQRACALTRSLTAAEPLCEPASTDANIPLSRGVPAVCMGAVRGALLHTRDEWVEKRSLVDGLALILAMMVGWDEEDAASAL